MQLLSFPSTFGLISSGISRSSSSAPRLLGQKRASPPGSPPLERLVQAGEVRNLAGSEDEGHDRRSHQM